MCSPLRLPLRLRLSAARSTALIFLCLLAACEPVLELGGGGWPTGELGRREAVGPAARAQPSARAWAAGAAGQEVQVHRAARCGLPRGLSRRQAVAQAILSPHSGSCLPTEKKPSARATQQQPLQGQPQAVRGQRRRHGAAAAAAQRRGPPGQRLWQRDAHRRDHHPAARADAGPMARHVRRQGQGPGGGGAGGAAGGAAAHEQADQGEWRRRVPRAEWAHRSRCRRVGLARCMHRHSLSAPTTLPLRADCAGGGQHRAGRGGGHVHRRRARARPARPRRQRRPIGACAGPAGGSPQARGGCGAVAPAAAPGRPHKAPVCGARGLQGAVVGRV